MERNRSNVVVVESWPAGYYIGLEETYWGAYGNCISFLNDYDDTKGLGETTVKGTDLKHVSISVLSAETYPQVVLAKESDNSSRRREYFVKCVSRLETGVEYWDFCFPAAQRGKAVHLTVDSRDSKVVGYIFP